ncbi:MAG TPA: phage terminase large subunit, partial [Candidatus Paceibacterota bacterium]|nr:phage terminase large subunit [Candidatus Paceibacterota bacterium]
GQIFMDYNPSDEFHWIYDKVLTREDCTFIKSTYLDNPFLPAETIKEIEQLKKLDANYWKIYGLGERGISEATIYSHWQYCDVLPEGGDEFYGLDFGYNHPTVLVQGSLRDNDLYSDEVIYRTHLTNSDLIDEMNRLEVSKKIPIYADSAEPQRIEEIRRAGFWVVPADKDVEKGIDAIKSRAWYITKRSVNMLKEVKSYKWKEKDGAILDEPVKINDDGMDATRYGVHTHTRKQYPTAGIGRGDIL